MYEITVGFYGEEKKVETILNTIFNTTNETISINDEEVKALKREDNSLLFYYEKNEDNEEINFSFEVIDYLKLLAESYPDISITHYSILEDEEVKNSTSFYVLNENNLDDETKKRFKIICDNNKPIS